MTYQSWVIEQHGRTWRVADADGMMPVPGTSAAHDAAGAFAIAVRHVNEKGMQITSIVRLPEVGYVMVVSASNR